MILSRTGRNCLLALGLAARRALRMLGTCASRGGPNRSTGELGRYRVRKHTYAMAVTSIPTANELKWDRII